MDSGRAFLPMRRAIALAREAAAAGEVPVGAVVMRGAIELGASSNRMIAGDDPTAHAEIGALRAAAAKLGTSRLDDCDLWVSLEPCAMCAAAIGLARIRRLYFAASDPKGGAVLHGPRLYGQPTCHHRPEIFTGIGEEESSALLMAFFAERRG